MKHRVEVNSKRTHMRKTTLNYEEYFVGAVLTVVIVRLSD